MYPSAVTASMIASTPRAAGPIQRAGTAGTAPPKTVGLSFDAGYADVAENGLPALTGHGFSATVFVSTGVVDGRASFGWYRRQPPVLGWNEIRELDREGTLRFGAHTVTH